VVTYAGRKVVCTNIGSRRVLMRRMLPDATLVRSGLLRMYGMLPGIGRYFAMLIEFPRVKAFVEGLWCRWDVVVTLTAGA